MAKPNFPSVPQNYRKQGLEDQFRAISQGRLNATGSVTLAVAATTTVVHDRRCGPNSVILLMPTTANAAAESPYILPEKFKFTITHINNSQADRTFQYVILG